MVFEGYHPILITIVLALGIPIAAKKPYNAFLLSIVLLVAGNVTMFNQTRTAFLGPYLNLGDTCLLISILALLFDKFRFGKPIFVPPVVLALLFVLTIAALQSFWKLGWTAFAMSI